MINVKSENSKHFSLICHASLLFPLGLFYSCIYLGTGSFVLTTLLFLLITVPFQKYQGKSKLFKKGNKDYLQAHHYLVLWYLFFKAVLGLWTYAWLTGDYFLVHFYLSQFVHL